MRVIHVVRQFAPSIGGLEEAVGNLARVQQARGLDVSIVTLDRVKGETERLPAREQVDGLPLRRIPFRGSWRYPLALGVLSAVAEADVVHVHAIDFFFDFLALTSPLHRKPLVASTHGGFFHTSFARRAKQVYFRTVTRASTQAYAALCATSESDLQLFRPIGGAALRLVSNGVDIDKFRDRACGHPVRHMIYVGRFSSNKNIPALFALLQRLRGLHADWSLTIAGRPSDVTTAALRAEADRFGLAAALTLIENPTNAAIAEAMATATYIVSASRHEGFGISVVEGLSAGLIPLLSRIPPFVSIVTEARQGLALDFADLEASAAAIESLHAGMLSCPGQARAAVIQAARRYTWETAADAIQDAYHAALAKQRPAAAPSLRAMS